MDKVVIMTTFANHVEAKRIARAAVDERLAACVNVLGVPVESTYRWKGKVQRAREVMVLMKTSRKKLTALHRLVESLHSYDVPEFIAVPIAAGSPAYLAWLEECLAAPRAATRKTSRSRP